MKRLLSIILAIAMLLSLSGCKLFKKLTPEDPMHTAMNYNGVSIKEYQIVCNKDGLDYNVRAAEYIQNAIKNVTGYAPAIVDDSEAEKSHEIVVGETSRQISAELNQTMSGVQFSMLTKGGTVALEGNYFVIAAAAYYFVDTYVKAGDVEIIEVEDSGYYLIYYVGDYGIKWQAQADNALISDKYDEEYAALAKTYTVMVVNKGLGLVSDINVG